MYRLAYGFLFFEISISDVRMLQEEAEKREQELQEKLRREEEERKERKKGAWRNLKILTFNSFF
jgi:predicted Holliday junction resolvase-like endonuclease